jgi:hypothetical protein
VAAHRRPTVVSLGQEAVVLRAQQADVVRAVIATHRERVTVVELEPQPLGAAPPLLVREAAPGAIALVDGAAHRGGDVA